MTTQPAPSPLISVALCTWNGERWLAEQLDSVLAQTGVEIEIIALDDASTDGTWAILEHYARRDSRIHLYRNTQNLGHLRSFEKCMALCHGEFIAPCDQDDIWLPGKLASLHSAIGDADLAYCDSQYIDAHGVPMGGRASQRHGMHAGRDPLPFLIQNTVSGHAMLLRRSLLSVAGPAPEGTYHDWWLALAGASRAGVRFVPETLVRWRRHAATATTMGASVVRQSAQARAKDWMSQRIALARALAALGLHHAGDCTTFANAMEQALAGNAWPMRAAAWRWRHRLMPQRRPAWQRALRLIDQVHRHVRRSQQT